MPATTSTLRNAQDTHTSGATANKTKSFRNMTTRVVKSGTDTRYTFIYFSRPFPLGATIQSAKLRFYTSSNPGNTTYTLKRITTAWSATKVTWNASPPVTTTGQLSVTADLAANSVLEFDVTSFMQATANGGQYQGWRLEANNATGVWFHSSLASKYKPELVVTWNVPPQEPIGLSPAGGRAVGTNKPILSYDFRDTNGEADIAAQQVEIYVNTDLSTPVFNSGEVLTDSPSFDLTGTAFTATQGAQYVWRVRTKDDSGVWSAWSSIAWFTYQAKGTLAMSTPAGSTITDPSPPVAWSLTGRTQSAWQVFVQDLSGKVLYNSGKFSSNATDWTIPAGAITTDGATYVIRVRVWDTISREAVPNSQVYLDATKNVTFAVTGGIAGVTSLTALQVGETPRVRLAWTRSEMPDGYLIKRVSDGVTTVIGPNVDPTDIDLSGTTYEFFDDTAPGNTTLTYSVHAIVNGQTGPATTATSFKTKVRGIWLSDTTTGARVQLLGDDAGSWSMEDAVGIHQPLGASFPVKITSALRGYSGDLNGYLMQMPNGPTVKAQENVIWEMKSKPDVVYWLHVSDICIPVLLANVTSNPTPRPEYEREVAFDFYQYGWGTLPFRPEL